MSPVTSTITTTFAVMMIHIVAANAYIAVVAARTAACTRRRRLSS